MRKRRIGPAIALVTIASTAMVSAAGRAAPADARSNSDPLAACHAAVRERPDALDSYRCFQTFAHGGGQFEVAERHLERLVQRADNNRARLILAAVLADRGRALAEPIYRAAIDAFSVAGDAATEARARLMLSATLMREGRLGEVSTQLAEAGELLARVPDMELHARLRIAEGWLAYRRNDYGRAWAPFKDQENDLLRLPIDLRSTWLSGLGAVAWVTGRVDEAKGYYVRQATMLHEAGDVYEEASARVSLTQITVDRDRKRLRAEAALKLAIAGGNPFAEARAHFYIGEGMSGAEKVAHARRALSLFRQTRDAVGIQMGLRAVAYATVAVDPTGAFPAIEEAIKRARSAGDWAEVARNSMVRSRMRWQTGPRAHAIADSVAVLDAIDTERRLQVDSLVRARRAGMWRIPYAELVARVLSPDSSSRSTEHPPGDLELAFATMERGRARSLLDHLDAVAVPSGGAVVPLEREHAELLKAIVRRQRKLLDPAVASSQKQEALVDVDRLERREIELRSELTRSAGDERPVPITRFPTLAELRVALAPGEALLEFQIWDGMPTAEGASFSWLLVSTRDTSRAYRLRVNDSVALHESVSLFAGLVDRRDGREAAFLRSLSDDLLGEALRDLPEPVTRLVIVPDGPLHYLPFDLLLTPGNARLGSRYHVSIAPSATIWMRWRQGASTAPARAGLAIVDPMPPGGGSRASRERAWTLPAGASLGVLPHARREAHALVSHTVSGRTQVLVGADATEATVKRTDLAGFGLLHFAAHAIVDDDHPERSAVLLAPGSDEEDGWLQPREIENLALAGKVVVLSACRSANGALIWGEGLVGLTDAFFRAGAHAVVASLWPLRDDEAAQIFEAFYRHAAEGMSVSAALADARRDRAAAGAPAAAWAGVIALGDGGIVLRSVDATLSPTRWRTFALGAGICLAVALGLLLAGQAARRSPYPSPRIAPTRVSGIAPTGVSEDRTDQR